MSRQARRAMRFYLAYLPVALSAALMAGESGGTEYALSVEVPTASVEAMNEAIQRGIDFLLERQNPNGSWGSPRNTKGLNIYAPAPGAHDAFRSAVTSLCLSALTEAGGDAAQAQEAIRRGETWLLGNLPRLRRATPDALYNVWGHSYSIQALVRRIQATPPADRRRKELEELLQEQIGFLKRYETVDGGWSYYDFQIGAKKPTASPTCFTTATGLIALWEAKGIGFEPPADLIDRALTSIRRQQKPDFSYLYGEYMRWRPMYLINRPGGSLGRSQACNLALRLWGDRKITNEVLKLWLERLINRNLWLDIGRKRPIPHESWFQVAGYFFYYGHYYAARCIEELPPKDRPPLQKRLAAIILRLQEKDGSWWDYPFYDYHQQYGTAFALMTLERCRKLPVERSW